MGAKTEIEWTDSTWSPLRVRVREDAGQIARDKGYLSLIQIGVEMAGRTGQHCEHVSLGCLHCYSGTWQSRCLKSSGTGLPFDRRSRDLIEPFVDEKTLTQPLHWRQAKKIFVENQSDIFGEWYTDEQIDRVFAVMALCPQHTFQVLTKRPERMQAYFAADTFCDSRVADSAFLVSKSVTPFALPSEDIFDARRVARGEHWEIVKWPLPNVWLGVSVEDQTTADERIPLLLKTLSAMRFVSYEPALGPVGFARLFPSAHGMRNDRFWLICGGESGPGAMLALLDRKGGDMAEWPTDLRIQEFPA